MNELDSRITILKQKLAKATKLSPRLINPIRPFRNEGSLKFNLPISNK